MLNIDDRLIREVSSKIGPKALSVLLAICIHLDKKTNTCFPSHQTLMRLTGISKNGVYDALVVLRDAGLVVAEQDIDSSRGRFGRRYFRVNTDLISVFVPAKDISPLPYYREPENREPENREPENREPENRETYQLNNEEQLNKNEQLNYVGERAREISGQPKAEKEKAPPIPAAPPAIGYRDRPLGVNTPGELMSAMQAFYSAFPREWSDGVLQLSGGMRYTQPEQDEIFFRFCTNAIQNNRQGDTFSQLNANLQRWFSNEKNMRRPSSAPAHQPTGRATIQRYDNNRAELLEKQKF